MWNLHGLQRLFPCQSKVRDNQSHCNSRKFGIMIITFQDFEENHKKFSVASCNSKLGGLSHAQSDMRDLALMLGGTWTKFMGILLYIFELDKNGLIY